MTCGPVSTTATMKLLSLSLLVFLYVLQVEGGDSADWTPAEKKKADSYRSLMNEFHIDVKRVYSQLQGKVSTDSKYVRDKIAKAMEAVRAKREAPQADDPAQTGGVMEQLQAALQGVQEAVRSAKDSEAVKELVEAAKKAGTNIQEAAQTLASNLAKSNN